LLLIAPLSEGFSAARPPVNNSLRQQSQIRAELLVPNTPVERKLAGGETHAYEVNLSADQFLGLVVEQRGVDVGLTLFDPEGARVREMDQRHGERGSERTVLIAKRAGSYRIEVRAIRKTAPPGSSR
jgi:hypothetical protein